MSPHRKQFRPCTHAPRAAALAAGAAAVALAACGGADPYAPKAQSAVAALTPLTLYSYNRARAPYYSALDLYNKYPVRPALQVTTLGNVPNFDLAFDVDSAGRILLLQPKQIVSPNVVPKTGFQTSSTPFDSLRAAPGGSYEQDSTVRVAVGQTVVVQAQGLACYSNGTFFYAKLVVDSLNAATGALKVRVTVDANCGFRSFASGVPTS